MNTSERVRITAVVEVTVDMLLTDAPGIRRFGMLDHFRPPRGAPIRSENGFSALVEVGSGDTTRRVLYDASLTASTVLHNLDALGVDLEALDAIVVSHAHPDHVGGIAGLLEARSAPIPVAVNFAAFLPKWLVDENGQRVLYVNEGFTRERLEALGAELIDTAAATEVVPGVMATGVIPSRTDFEPPVPPRPGRDGIFVEHDDGELVNDDAALDEQGLAIPVGDRLVVLSACGHSGMINTVHHAREIAGVQDVRALLGGFHFGFPGVPEANLPPTLDELEALQLDVLAPMHCTGLRAQAAMLGRFPEQYVQNVGGTTLTFNGQG